MNFCPHVGTACLFPIDSLLGSLNWWWFWRSWMLANMSAPWFPSRRRVQNTASTQICPCSHSHIWMSILVCFMQTLQRIGLWFLDEGKSSTETTSFSKSVALETGVLSVCNTFFLKRLFLFSRFEHTPLMTPNGDMLIKDLNFKVNLLTPASEEGLLLSNDLSTFRFTLFLEGYCPLSGGNLCCSSDSDSRPAYPFLKAVFTVKQLLHL